MYAADALLSDLISQTYLGISMQALLLLLTVLILVTACKQDAANQDMDVVCKDPRPEICTMNYLPVCGISSDETVKTYANGCTACSNQHVLGYREGACK